MPTGHQFNAALSAIAALCEVESYAFPSIESSSITTHSRVSSCGSSQQLHQRALLDTVRCTLPTVRQCYSVQRLRLNPSPYRCIVYAQDAPNLTHGQELFNFSGHTILSLQYPDTMVHPARPTLAPLYRWRCAVQSRYAHPGHRACALPLLPAQPCRSWQRLVAA